MGESLLLRQTSPGRKEPISVSLASPIAAFGKERQDSWLPGRYQHPAQQSAVQWEEFWAEREGVWAVVPVLPNCQKEFGQAPQFSCLRN